MTPEQVARLFHETYERLAPQFGYETRKASAKPWDEVPKNNRDLMIAVSAVVLTALTSKKTALPSCGSVTIDLHPETRDPHLADPIPGPGPTATVPEFPVETGKGLPPSKLDESINQGRWQ